MAILTIKGQLFNAGFSCVPEIITGAVQSILRFSDDLSHAAQAAADSSKPSGNTVSDYMLI